ncbi:hypothetical protein BDW74DRAFT_155071 [Aspergillus multicolor]|uniref:uncharacterized protein n=1 Tax=Aspergillus multicolor TaxID=41759 RepID=UPI003CCDC681
MGESNTPALCECPVSANQERPCSATGESHVTSRSSLPHTLTILPTTQKPSHHRTSTMTTQSSPDFPEIKTRGRKLKAIYQAIGDDICLSDDDLTELGIKREKMSLEGAMIYLSSLHIMTDASSGQVGRIGLKLLTRVASLAALTTVTMVVEMIASLKAPTLASMMTMTHALPSLTLIIATTNPPTPAVLASTMATTNALPTLALIMVTTNLSTPASPLSTSTRSCAGKSTIIRAMWQPMLAALSLVADCPTTK